MVYGAINAKGEKYYIMNVEKDKCRGFLQGKVTVVFLNFRKMDKYD